MLFIAQLMKKEMRISDGCIVLIIKAILSGVNNDIVSKSNLLSICIVIWDLISENIYNETSVTFATVG